jgi:LacI family transcriptional regulator
MASRGRKSVGAVEMAHDLGVSTATVSRALNGSLSQLRDLVGTRIAGLARSRGTAAPRHRAPGIA